MTTSLVLGKPAVLPGLAMYEHLARQRKHRIHNNAHDDTEANLPARRKENNRPRKNAEPNHKQQQAGTNKNRVRDKRPKGKPIERNTWHRRPKRAGRRAPRRAAKRHALRLRRWAFAKDLANSAPCSCTCRRRRHAGRAPCCSARASSLPGGGQRPRAVSPRALSGVQVPCHSI